MSGFTCGVWLGPRGRGLVAVVVDEDGRAQPPLRFDRDRDAAWELLAWIDNSVGLDWELVLPAWLARQSELASFALERGNSVWLVPPAVLDTVRVVANLATGPPARTAAALARLPLASAVRSCLRRLDPPEQNQLPLF